jgi:4'-phosphopantetheinyl transferase EntD
MPLFYQHNINETTKLGIWQITEGEDFFLESVPLKRDVSHAQKKLQHLAGRYLLKILFNDFPLEEILIADTRKPYLEDDIYHFSISHFGGFAAAIVSASNRVGIDIESVSPTVEKVMRKFLSAAEILIAFNGIEKSGHRLRQLTLLWSAKESIFKWYSLGKVDFREHIEWVDPYFVRSGKLGKLSFVFKKELQIPLTVQYKLFDDLILAFVVT